MSSESDKVNELNVLQSIFINAQKKTPCSGYYCTTCGGIAGVVQPIAASLASDEIISAFSDPTSLGLSSTDFDYYPLMGGFPKEPNISPYVSFLRSVFMTLPGHRQGELTGSWMLNVAHWPVWLFDGFSYYICSGLPAEAKENWRRLIVESLEREHHFSLQETLMLKYEHT